MPDQVDWAKIVEFYYWSISGLYILSKHFEEKCFCSLFDHVQLTPKIHAIPSRNTTLIRFFLHTAVICILYVVLIHGTMFIYPWNETPLALAQNTKPIKINTQSEEDFMKSFHSLVILGVEFLFPQTVPPPDLQGEPQIQSSTALLLFSPKLRW